MNLEFNLCTGIGTLILLNDFPFAISITRKILNFENDKQDNSSLPDLEWSDQRCPMICQGHPPRRS